MAITLADAQSNCAEDIDYAVIDEFRKSSWFIDNLTFDDAVSPGGGGSTLTYGYTRLVTERSATFRDFNTEGTDGKAVTAKQHIELVPINAVYTLDRVLAHLGPAASDEVALQSQQAIKAVRAKFGDAVINGGANSDLAFDGLNAALAGSTTEVGSGTSLDWTGVDTQAEAFAAMSAIDDFLGSLDGAPTAIIANKKALSKIRAFARLAGYYDRSKDDFGRVVESYNGIPFVDPGQKDGSSTDIIPIQSRDVDGGGAGGTITGLTDIYAVRLGMDGFHGVSTIGGNLLKTWLPDFTTAGAVKKGEVEMGPVAVALKATKAAAVLRNVKVQ